MEAQEEILKKKRKGNAVKISNLLRSGKSLSLEDSNANNDANVHPELGNKDGSMSMSSPSPNDVENGQNGDIGLGNFEKLRETNGSSDDLGK